MLVEYVAKDLVVGHSILDPVTGQVYEIGSIENKEEKCSGLNCSIDPKSGCGGRVLCFCYKGVKETGVIACESKIFSKREVK